MEVVMSHPDWALKYKRKGTELRFINNTYYLYEITSKWNPEKKRAQKITGNLLGKVTKQGFIPSAKDRLRHAKQIDSVLVKEYGASRFIYEYMNDFIKRLRHIFTNHWEQIFICALLRLLYHSPLKNMSYHFNNSYLSTTFGSLSLSAKKLGTLLRDIGYQRSRIVEFCRGFVHGDDFILIAATHMVSKSTGISIAHHGYNGKREFDPQVNLLFIFSATLQLPVYYRLIRGNIREVKAFKLSLIESGITDAIIIADKGFYSQANIEQLHEEELRYIIPLRRNSTLIDYSVLSERDKKSFAGYFTYHKRYIWYYSHACNGATVYVYLDEQLKNKEEHDYLNRIETHPEACSLDAFYEKQSSFGTMALFSNVEVSNAETIYHHYKSRNTIEVMIDAMKNVSEADRSYMHTIEALEGWLFVNYLALQWYYKIYNMLQKKKLPASYSPNDLLMHLAEIKKVKINETWYTAEINSKTQKLIDKIGIHIT